MVANVAFLAALTTFLAVAWLAGELSFLAPFKAGIFRNHGVAIGVTIAVLFLNLFAAYYGIARWLFLRDAGLAVTSQDIGPAAEAAFLGRGDLIEIVRDRIEIGRASCRERV